MIYPLKTLFVDICHIIQQYIGVISYIKYMYPIITIDVHYG